MMKIGCIIQARTTSTRLKNKIFLNLPYNSDKTVLDQVVNRVKKSEYVNQIILATTINKTDGKVKEFADSNDIKCFRGSEENVLERFYLVAKENDLDIIVRITSDCPCLDTKVLDKIIKNHIDNSSDYSSNTLKRTYPHGMDVEIFNYNILKEAYNNSSKIYEKEHVTPYIYKSNPDKFKLQNIEYIKDLKDIRITVDTIEDYTLICSIYDYLGEKFGVEDIEKLFNEKPWLYNINNKVEQKKIYENIEEEMTELNNFVKRKGLDRVKELIEK